MKASRKTDAVPTPLPAPPLFLRSATFDSMVLRYSSKSGMAHTRSPAASAAVSRRARSAGSLANSEAETPRPMAAMLAPVRVAMSTTAFGWKRCTYQRASASARRPSASVLSTSIESPLPATSTSEGRKALPSGMFSTQAHTASTRTGRSSSATACMAPSTAAAPAMSAFMGIMPSRVLSDRPPVSNVTPLPTSATSGRSSRPALCSSSMIAGSVREPWATARKAPMPSPSAHSRPWLSKRRPVSAASWRAVSTR